MKIGTTTFLELLGRDDVRFAIPVYQRVYSWQAPQLHELWDDMMAASQADRAHFVGTVFYTADEDNNDDSIELLDVIDGQQRLTTMTLMLCALRDVLAEKGVAELPSSDELSKKYLEAETSSGKVAKLELSRADKPTMDWIAIKAPHPADKEEFSKLVNDSYTWFKAHMEEENCDLAQVLDGAKRLTIIEVHMEDGDRPQTVFESLNAKGLSLSVPDLVRNLILEQPGFESPSYLYEKYWEMIDDTYASDDDGGATLTHAIRTWLGGGLSMKDDQAIYDAFKASLHGKESGAVESRVAGLRDHCLRFHEKVAAQDETTLAEIKAWEDARGKAERLRNDRKIFGD